MSSSSLAWKLWAPIIFLISFKNNNCWIRLYISPLRLGMNWIGISYLISTVMSRLIRKWQSMASVPLYYQVHLTDMRAVRWSLSITVTISAKQAPEWWLRRVWRNYLTSVPLERDNEQMPSAEQNEPYLLPDTVNPMVVIGQQSEEGRWPWLTMGQRDIFLVKSCINLSRQSVHLNPLPLSLSLWTVLLDGCHHLWQSPWG